MNSNKYSKQLQSYNKDVIAISINNLNSLIALKDYYYLKKIKISNLIQKWQP